MPEDFQMRDLVSIHFYIILLKFCLNILVDYICRNFSGIKWFVGIIEIILDRVKIKINIF